MGRSAAYEHTMAVRPAADTFIIVDDAQEANYLHVVPVGENKPALLRKKFATVIDHE